MKKISCALLALVLALTLSVSLAEDVIKIGVCGPLTGPYAIYGNATVNGAKIAAEEINALGGIQFEVLERDDQGDGEKAVAGYNAMLDEGAMCMLGTVTSGACMAVASVAYEDRIFMLTPTASNDLVIEDNDNVFQVCFRDSAQGSASATYIAEHMPGKKVGIIYNNALDYSIGIRATFKSTAAELGVEIVADSAFSSDQDADFSVQVAKMKEAGAEIVFLPIYYTPAAKIMIQSKAVDFSPVFFGVDGMDGILALEGFDTALAEGVMLLSPFSADAEDDLTKNFVSKYVDNFGEIPNQFAADGYDGMYALKAAFEAAGITADTTPEDACELLIPSMQQIEITGVTGTMHWDENGAVTKSPIAVVIENGAYVLAK